MFTHAPKGSSSFKPVSLLLAPAEELWLAVVGVVIFVCLASASLASGSHIALNCDAHGRAALICRPETAALTAPANSNCASFGRGGRVCSSRP